MQATWAWSAIHSRRSAAPCIRGAFGNDSVIALPPASRTRSDQKPPADVSTPTDGRRRGKPSPLTAVQLLHEELARATAVGLAAAGFHDLSDEKADDLVVPFPDPLGLVGVGRYRLVHHRGELVAAHGGEALALDDGARRLARGEGAGEDVPGDGAAYGAALDEVYQLDHVPGRDRGIADAGGGLVHQRAQLARDPVGRLLGIRPRGDLLVERRELAVGREDARVIG